MDTSKALITEQCVRRKPLLSRERKIPDPLHTRLPDELFLQIFQFIKKDEHLIEIAKASSRFNHLSLEILFARYKVNISSGVVTLGSKHHSVKALPGLAVSLAADNAILKYLSCDLTEGLEPSSNLRPLVIRVRALTRFVARLASVERVSLKAHFLIPGPAGDALLDLLRVVVNRSCTSLRIRSFLPSISDWESLSDTLPETTQNWASTILQHAPLIGSLFLPAKEEPPPRLRATELEVCLIETLPGFLRPFYTDILAISPRLTTLSFTRISDAQAWAELVEGVQFPALSSFSITSCTVPAMALARFFTNHPTITDLDIHGITLIEDDDAFLATELASALPALKFVKTSPRFLVLNLLDLNIFPALESITLLLGKKKSALDRLAETMAAFFNISACQNRISLTVEFSSAKPFEEWISLRIAGAEMESQPESLMQCVRSFTVDTHSKQPFELTALARISSWLHLFPELEEFTISHRCLPRGLHRPPNGFIDGIVSQCLFLKTVRVDLRGRKN